MEYTWTVEYWNTDELPPSVTNTMEFKTSVLGTGEDFDALKAWGVKRFEDEWPWNFRWGEWQVWNSGDLQGCLYTFTMTTSRGGVDITQALVLHRVPHIKAESS